MQSFPPTSTEAFKALARAWAATVTVVTARRPPDSTPPVDGFTATAFMTVSMAPPVVAVAVTKSSSASDLFGDAFAVNLLSPDQVELATAFAKSRLERASYWAQTVWTPDESGSPLFAGTAGAFSARVRQLVDAGDHMLVLGDVTRIHVGTTSETLAYHNRGYARVAPKG